MPLDQTLQRLGLDDLGHTEATLEGVKSGDHRHRARLVGRILRELKGLEGEIPDQEMEGDEKLVDKWKRLVGESALDSRGRIGLSFGEPPVVQISDASTIPEAQREPTEEDRKASRLLSMVDGLRRMIEELSIEYDTEIDREELTKKTLELLVKQGYLSLDDDEVKQERWIDESILSSNGSVVLKNTLLQLSQDNSEKLNGGESIRVALPVQFDVKTDESEVSYCYLGEDGAILKETMKYLIDGFGYNVSLKSSEGFVVVTISKPQVQTKRVID